MKKEYVMVALGLLIGSILGSLMLYLVPEQQTSTLYYNQVGLYSSQENASQAASQLESAGFEHYIVHKEDQYYLIANFTFEQSDNAEVTTALQNASLSVVAKEVSCPSDLSIDDPDALIDYLESR